jgi:hypothetical protein
VNDTGLMELGERLASIGGVLGVMLGGSRARGAHRPDSDYDLGMYYRGEVDVAALRALAAEVADEPAEVTAPGARGTWVNGGGWLTVQGSRMDWIYRDLNRVRRVWDACQAGRYTVAAQIGHPLGFYTHAYAGEVALGRVLADPSGELTGLREETLCYPPALGDVLVDGLWEADFAVRLAGYGASGADPTYAAGCLFRAVGVACHALHGRAGRWLINEKGMVASAAGLTVTPPDFPRLAHEVLGAVGRSPVDVARTVAQAEDLMAKVRATVGAGA